MKELSREHRAVMNFKLASAQVASLVSDEENIMFTRFYDAFEGGVAYFIQSELHFRQGDRCRVLGIRPGTQREVVALGQTLNRKGIEMLTVSQAMLAEFGNGLGKEPAADPKFQKKLLEFQRDAREVIVDLELKASDVKELDDVLSEVVAAVGSAKSSKDMVAFLSNKLKKLAEVRASEGRGAETNIAIWKLVAAAALLLVGAWVVYKCYYSKWKCSKSEKAIYNSIFSVAMMVFGACE